jgi:hypothetical protein
MDNPKSGIPLDELAALATEFSDALDQAGIDRKPERKIIHLPGTVLSPEVVLHRTLGKLPRIKAVLVLMQWDDLSMSVDWSQMKMSELCMAAMTVQRAVGIELDGGFEPSPDERVPT